MDIMILVDLPDDELYQYADELAEWAKYNVAHDIWMMPVVKNQEHFNHWVDAYPFYENVQKEGVGGFMKQPDLRKHTSKNRNRFLLACFLLPENIYIDKKDHI